MGDGQLCYEDTHEVHAHSAPWAWMTRSHMTRPVLTLFVWPELVPAVLQHQPCHHPLLAPCSTLQVRGAAYPDAVKQQGSMAQEVSS